MNHRNGRVFGEQVAASVPDATRSIVAPSDRHLSAVIDGPPATLTPQQD
ncbi:hypothetical protein [Thioalkalivibrio thiocyanodenitrificans]|nr:hypothetical protein [Thioalkalivibrio thiocyanodenitrificans]